MNLKNYAFRRYQEFTVKKWYKYLQIFFKQLEEENESIKGHLTLSAAILTRPLHQKEEEIYRSQLLTETFLSQFSKFLTSLVFDVSLHRASQQQEVQSSHIW